MVWGLYIPNLVCGFGALGIMVPGIKKLRPGDGAFFLAYYGVAMGLYLAAERPPVSWRYAIPWPWGWGPWPKESPPGCGGACWAACSCCRLAIPAYISWAFPVY